MDSARESRHDNMREPQRNPLQASVGTHEEGAEEEVCCRYCYSPGGLHGRLSQPCKCRGSVSSVHQACLEIWMKTSRNRRCEICGHKYTWSNSRPQGHGGRAVLFIWRYLSANFKTVFVYRACVAVGLFRFFRQCGLSRVIHLSCLFFLLALLFQVAERIRVATCASHPVTFGILFVVFAFQSFLDMMGIRVFAVFREEVAWLKIVVWGCMSYLFHTTLSPWCLDYGGKFDPLSWTWSFDDWWQLFVSVSLLAFHLGTWVLYLLAFWILLDIHLYCRLTLMALRHAARNEPPILLVHDFPK